ncbi:hypothetical protein QTH97_31235 [Variovorax sp. J22R24]|uniref:hypothetical protein n=1 Tax=Variovorax gracilis TaxID=3053502 RepID=UPI002575BEDD|nr:hypothetical protein [Variovorax sp. J22R24]MDM0109436.1 hypothetical protein [Variovorax sp. J22R24]
MAQAAAEASSGSKAANISTTAAAVNEHGPFMMSSFLETTFLNHRHSFSNKLTLG